MASKWNRWYPLEDYFLDVADHFGIYQIRLVDGQNAPICIPRIGGADLDGIIYIGRSGFSYAKSLRTVNQRLKEFLYRAHSGGEKFEYAESKLRRSLGAFHAEFRSMQLGDRDILSEEKRQLEQYRDIYCELPPYNGSMPRRT